MLVEDSEERKILFWVYYKENENDRFINLSDTAEDGSNKVPYTEIDMPENVYIGVGVSDYKVATSKDGLRVKFSEFQFNPFECIIDLPATTTRETTHGICTGNGSFAQAFSTQADLTYQAITPFTGIQLAWDDRRYTLSGQENTPCADGIFLRPFRHKTITRGTKITVAASEGSTICVFVDMVGSRDGGWPLTLNGFNKTTPSGFKWSAPDSSGQWTMFCREAICDDK